MIKITAKANEKGVGLNIKAEGKAEDVINEALAIVDELPKSLENTDPDLYHEFLRKQLLHNLDNLRDALGSDPDDDEEGDDEPDEQ